LIVKDRVPPRPALQSRFFLLVLSCRLSAPAALFSAAEKRDYEEHFRFCQQAANLFLSAGASPTCSIHLARQPRFPCPACLAGCGSCCEGANIREKPDPLQDLCHRFLHVPSEYLLKVLIGKGKSISDRRFGGN
jgi:hypothetical protein